MLPLKQRSKILTALTLAALTGALLLQSHPAFAQISLSGSSTGTVSVSAGGGALFSSGTNFLTALQTLLTSTWATLIATIAVVCLGFAWMFGRVSMHIALSVCGGIILVFSAAAIVSSISASVN